MTMIATATLQTPWDCKWGRFGRMQSRGPNRPAEGLWVCLHGNGARRPIDVSECETCPHWEYEQPQESPAAQGSSASVVHATSVAACLPGSAVDTRLELAVRVVALAVAVLLAGTGFVVLTSPLAIPLTIALWMGAVTSFVLGVWGNFDRRSTASRSW
jgi:hypothetical protein